MTTDIEGRWPRRADHEWA